MRFLAKFKKPKATRMLGGALGLLLALSLVLVPATPVLAVPQAPHQFYGQVTIDGIQADEGITVLAKIDGMEFSTEVDADGNYGYDPLFRVPADDPDDPGIDGGTNGDIIEFYVADILATTFTFRIGDIDELPLSIVVPGPQPVADFSADLLIGVEPLTVQFTDLSLADSPTWLWDFGDGETSDEASPIHEYLQDDIYTVSLTVTTAYGSDTKVKTDYITVTDTEPVASFTADPTSGDYPLEVSFNDTSTSYDVIILWEWDCSYKEGPGFIEERTGPTPTYIYDTEGIYSVALRVTDADGSIDMKVREDLIGAQPEPVADFSADPLTGPEPLTVQFTDESLNMADNPTWVWVFGDGSVSTEENPNHQYSQGSYRVSLTVTTAYGSDTKVKLDYITVTEPSAPPVPVADFSADLLIGVEPLTVQFTDESLNMADGATWSWDFGDGGTSAEASPTYQYLWDDIYTVSLTVTTAYGSNTEVKPDYITVTDTEPVASFTAAPESGDYPLLVSFTDTSDSYDGITSWAWDFGDGGISTEANPTYTYEADGTYTVALIVTEADDDSDSIVAMELITVTVPSDTTPPVIEYAWLEYPVGAESARPGEPFIVGAVVTDDIAVTLVEVETPFDTFPLDVEVHEGVSYYWAVIEVPEETLFGTYELTLIAVDAAENKATESLELNVVPALTAYNIWLADGWNLISLPLIPDVTASGTILDGLSFFGEDMVRTVWGDETAAWMMPEIEVVWYYDAAGEYGTPDWLFFEPDAGVGDLPEIEDGKGYWVDLVSIADEADEELSPMITVYGVELVSGPTLPPTYAVVEGWNLIGFKETRHMPATEYLSAVADKYARVYGYDAYGQYFYLVGEGGPDHMQPGSGYWIYMTDDGCIVP